MISRTLLISGTPRTGKTTIAEYLSQKYNIKCISLSSVVLEHNLFESIDEKRNTKIVDDEALEEYIKDYFVSYTGDLIIEGHYADADYISHESIIMAVVLRCSPKELEVRLSARDYNEDKIYENVQSELIGTCAQYMLDEKPQLNKHGKIFEFDTTHKSAIEIAEIIYSIFIDKSDGTKYKIGAISWLSDPSVKITDYL